VTKGKGFGVVLRNLRERGGYSRRELAEAAGLSEGAVRDYELGKRSPAFAAVCRLCVALGTKPNTFAATADTSGAFHLQPKPRRVPYSLLTFGRYKGRRINEVPTDFLYWLKTEKPRLLKLGQLEEIEKLWRERALLRDHPPLEEDEVREREHQAHRATRTAAQTDPVLARALAEKANPPPPKIPDPEFFGGK
jgi:transcriptional regulator with XRE-family HTH domain